MTAAEIFADAWARLAAGVVDAGHPFRNAFVATIDGATGPTVRTVVLRAANRDAGTIDFHTDRRSPKYIQLQADPRVGWVFWHDADRVQLRLQTVATLHTDDASADDGWATLSDTTRSTYATPVAPGTVLAEAPDHAPAADAAGRARFVIVRCRIESIEWLKLRREGSLRVRFTSDGEIAEWLAP